MTKRLLIAFDVDDTLIVPAIATGFDIDTPNYENISLYKWFQAQGCEMIIWSGGGADYAQRWAEKLGLRADHYLDKHYKWDAKGNFYEAVNPNPDHQPDISFDDSDLALAKVNVKVRRVNNKVVRYPDRVGKNKVEPQGAASD